MSKILVIGAGGVGNVVCHILAQHPETFSQIILASRTLQKCQDIAEKIQMKYQMSIVTEQLDADRTKNVISIIEKHNPDVVINVALPYQNIPVMKACIRTGKHYIDTSAYEPKHAKTYEYSWQLQFEPDFREAGITGILSLGFDPGVVNVFTAYARKHYFDEIHYLDIIDCNAGDHGQYFATNFNPEVNIREILLNPRYWHNGRWVEHLPLEVHKPIEYPDIGERESYLMYHEELESLVRNFPEIKRARFWMTFTPKYIQTLTVLKELGFTSIYPVRYKNIEISPLDFLTLVLPKPDKLGEHYTGQTCIGCQIRGIKNGQERTYFIWNTCFHQDAYRKTGSQAISYTTGVPAVLGAYLLVKGIWKKPGLFYPEQFDPDPFMNLLPSFGLPWHEEINKPLSVEKYPDPTNT